MVTRKTNMETNTCGVPEGWILGHLYKLFEIFVNELWKVTKYLYHLMFADDTNLFCSQLSSN